MTAIANSLPVSSYGYSSASGSTVATAAVAATSDPSLAQTAVTLSANASIAATLAGGTSANSPDDAVELLNAIVQAGTPSSLLSPTGTGATSPAAQQSKDQALVGSLPAPSSTSGLYDASGILQSTPSTGVASRWATILKANPDFAGTVMTDALNQGIVGLISTSA